MHKDKCSFFSRNHGSINNIFSRYICPEEISLRGGRGGRGGGGTTKIAPTGGRNGREGTNH